jgi:CMP/dCMP kinase
MAVITISRQYFSGGNEIADRVCTLLRYRYFDKRLIAEVAAEFSRATGTVVDFNEDQYRVPSFLDRLLNRMPQRPVTTVGAWTESPTGVRTREISELDAGAAIALEQAAIKAAYDQGSVMIVGRGGQAILQGKPGVLHVRVEAPLDWRTKRLCEVEEFTPIAAKEEITEHDRAAADYVKRFYGVNWADPSLYHLFINCDLWGVDAAARLIVSAVECLQGVVQPR